MQQINLYQPIFRKQRKVFSALALFQVCLAMIAGLLLIYVYARWQVQELEQVLARLQAQQVAAVSRVEDLNKRYAGRTKSAALEQEVARLEADVAAKQTVLQSFSGGGFGNSAGFSKYLEGLAKQRVEGMWLTGLSISAGGGALTIFGSTLAPELVPAFLQQLGKEPAFAGAEFKTLLMERPNTDTARIDFTLRTTDSVEEPARIAAQPAPQVAPAASVEPTQPGVVEKASAAVQQLVSE
ncbi:MAG: PilN domain-containing protein [Pseudomonadota bacterium]